LSYQMPEKPFEIFEEDFTKTMMDYLMFKQGIDVKEFSDSLVKKVMYDSKISSKESDITIVLKGKEVHNETN
jgi:type I restriction enzyme M protein